MRIYLSISFITNNMVITGKQKKTHDHGNNINFIAAYVRNKIL